MENAELWLDYKKNKSNKAKEELIKCHMEIVKIVVGRLYTKFNSNVEYEDLISYGVVGLIDAIEKFDISKNIKFKTYASIRIRGSIIDQIREIDWVPRSVRQKAKIVERAIQSLEQELNRYPTELELAEKLEIEKGKLITILNEISSFNIISLEEKIEKGVTSDIPKDEKNLPEDLFLENELKEVLRKTIEKLPEKEKMIITLYYYEELTYKEIGKILNISESRVSQIHSKAISYLKSHIN